MLTWNRYHRLERFECLNSSFEADGSWVDALFGCGLSHYCADQIVGQDVRPDFLPNKFWCFAPQQFHLHRLF